MQEQEIRICSYDVLPNGFVKPSALQRYFQQIGLDDIAACGASYPTMRSMSMVFVLTKLQLDMIRPIRSGDVLLLKTFPYKIEGVLFFRGFELWNGGELVAFADSRWVLLNYDKRTIMRPSDFPFPLVEQAPSVTFPVMPRRIQQSGGQEQSVLRTVRLTELDENHHLNNCCYADYCLDHAPVDVCRHFIRSMCIIFDHEAYLGDVLELRYQQDETGFSVLAQNTTAEKPCFQAKFSLDFSEET